MRPAYIDLAAGGMVVQMVVAAAVAIPFFLRSHISRGLSRLRRGTASTDVHETRLAKD